MDSDILRNLVLSNLLGNKQKFYDLCDKIRFSPLETTKIEILNGLLENYMNPVALISSSKDD